MNPGNPQSTARVKEVPFLSGSDARCPRCPSSPQTPGGDGHNLSKPSQLQSQKIPHWILCSATSDPAGYEACAPTRAELCAVPLGSVGNLPQPGRELALDIPQSWLSAATRDAPAHCLLCGPATGPLNNYTLTHTQPQRTVSTRASSSDKLLPNNK